MLLFQFVPALLSLWPVSACPSAVSASVFLPCRYVHLYHCSKFPVYSIIRDTCFSLTSLCMKDARSIHITTNDPVSLLFILLFFSHSVVSCSLQPHGLQHARLPCPSPTPGACSDSCPLSWWCHPTISFSVVPFSPCLKSFPTSGSFFKSQFFASGGQSIGASAPRLN